MDIKKLYDSFFNTGDMLLPYTNDDEVLRDLFSYLDLCFTLVTGARGFNADSIPKREQTGSALGMSVSSGDLGELLISGRNNGTGDRLSEEAMEQIENAYIHIECRRKRGLELDFMSHFDIVCLKFGLSELERFALLLALSVDYDRKYEAVYTYLHNNTSDFLPTKWLAVKLYEYLFGSTGDHSELLAESPLCRFLCDNSHKRRERGESAQRLTLTARVSSYILGRNEPDPLLREYCRIYPHFVPELHIENREDKYICIRDIFVGKAFAEKPRFALNIYGPVGIGRRCAAGRAVDELDLNMLDIDLYKLITNRYDELDRYLDMIYTETELLGAVPCFTIDAAMTETDKDGGVRRSPVADKVKRAADCIVSVFGFFFWVTAEKSDMFVDNDMQFISVELPMLTATERKKFWDRYLGDCTDTNVFANQYILTPDGIRKAVETASDMARLKGTKPDRDMIAEAVRQHTVNQLGSYAQKINAVFTWDDLVVSDDQKRRMKIPRHRKRGLGFPEKITLRARTVRSVLRLARYGKNNGCAGNGE